MSDRDVLFIPYSDTIALLEVSRALQVCEEVLRMQARGSIVWSEPPSLRLDADEPFHNHWQIKGVLLKERQVAGVRLYNYFDDGARNTVGSLGRLGFVLVSNALTAEPLAIVDEHWSYAIRAAASPAVVSKWLAPARPRVLALVGVGMMGEHALRCLASLFAFEEIRCASRRAESREQFAQKWRSKLGTKVVAYASIAEAVSGADIVVGGTTSSDVVCREHWLKPGCLFISLARRELDPSGWSRMDKVVVDSWDFNMRMPMFRAMVETGQFSKAQLHAEFHEIVSGAKVGRTQETERILIHTCGLVAQDVALAHEIYLSAVGAGRGIRLPSAYQSDDASRA